MRFNRSRSGHTLSATLVFLLLITLLWVGTLRQMVQGLALETAFARRETFATGPLCAAAWGLSLLETGLPPEEGYACQVTLGDGDTYVVTFTSQVDLNYILSVRPATQADLFLPEIPTSF